MIGLLIFNGVMILLGGAIAVKIIPARMLQEPLRVMHITFGITTPAPDQLRIVALFWIGALTLILDVLLFLFLYLVMQMK
jgi:hypothetical protein